MDNVFPLPRLQGGKRSADDLVAHIYDSALDPGCWETVLDQLASFMRAKSGMLRLIDHHGLVVVENRHTGFDPAYQALYEQYYLSLDPFFRTIPKLGPIGTVHPFASMISGYDLERTEFYCDFMRPQEIGSCIGAYLYSDSDRVVYFGLQRSPSAPLFGRADARRLAPMVGHLQRAYRINMRMGSLQAELTARDGVLDRLQLGIVLLNRSGKVVYLNGAAERIVSGEHPVTMRGGKLVATNPMEDRKLQEQLWHASAADERVHGAIKLTDSAEGGISVIAAPLSCPGHSLAPGHPDAAAAVFLDSTGVRSATDVRVLTALYGLTAAESKVCIELANGVPVAEIAERFGTRECTVRSQLKSAMHKTGTKRQAELVRLLSGLLQLQL